MDRMVVEANAGADYNLIASGCTLRANVQMLFGCILPIDCCVDFDLSPCLRLVTFGIDQDATLRFPGLAGGVSQQPGEPRVPRGHRNVIEYVPARHYSCGCGSSSSSRSMEAS
jgi:hypothetical protein